MGRNSSYTPEIADLICSELIEGKSLRSICSADGMPRKATVLRWLMNEEYAAFRDQYARARELQVERYVDEITDIADDTSQDYIELEDGRKVADHEHIQRSRLRIDSRKWIAAKLLPKKYGERSTIELDATENLAAVLLERRKALSSGKTIDVVAETD